MTTVANSFKGYQYYEFALLKDLTPESRKLAEQTSQQGEDGDRYVFWAAVAHSLCDPLASLTLR